MSRAGILQKKPPLHITSEPLKRSCLGRLGLVFLCVLSAPSHADFSADYFPLNVDSYWLYDGTATVYQDTGISVSHATTKTLAKQGMGFSGALTTTLLDDDLSPILGQGGRALWYFANSLNGITLYQTSRPGATDCTPYAPPIIYFPTSFTIGDTFNGSADFTCHVNSNDYPIQVNRVARILGYEKITVPAGTFDALKLEENIIWTETITGIPVPIQWRAHHVSWYAYKIGEIRRKWEDYNPKNALDVNGELNLIASDLNGDRSAQKDDGNNCDCSIGDPINYGTGNSYQTELDYQSTGPFPLRFQRAYNSRTAVATDLGSNWRHNYSAHLHFIQSGAKSTAIMVRPNGKAYTFQQNGTTWNSDADVNDKLVTVSDSNGNITSARYINADDETESYDATGKLLAIQNRAGLTHMLAYNSVGLQLTSVTDNFGHKLSFSYDTANRISAVSDPAGQNINYGYDGNNNLISVAFQNGKVRNYRYNETAYTGGTDLAHALTSLKDENNAVFTIWNYDSLGRAISSEHASGVEKVSITYNADNTRTVTDSLNQPRQFGTQKLLGVSKNTSLSSPCSDCRDGNSATKTYDANGNVATRTDFNGNVTTYTYDLTRNLETSRTEAFGKPEARTITTQWHPTYRLPTQITEPNRATILNYDPQGNLIQKAIISTGGARVWTYTYTTAADGTLPNLLKSVDGPRTDAPDLTQYYYDTQGNLTSVINALNQTTRILAYDPHGHPLLIQDPNGLITSLAYDLRGRLVSRTVGNETTSYNYDGVGQLTQITLPDSSFIAITYDAAHRLTGISDSLGNHIAYTLDNMGNRVREDVYDPANALAQTRTRVFDALSRLAQDIGAQNQTTTYGYDANGNRTVVIDPVGNTTINAYDALNRLIQVTDPSTGLTRYGYDANDHLAQVADPRALVTTYNYDGLDNLNQTISPDTGSTINTYDDAGNIKTATDARGKTASYTYDALNRVIQLAYTGTTGIAFQYDQGPNAIGKLSGMGDETGGTQWSYNSQGRVAGKFQQVGAMSQALGYSYDNGGRLSQIAYPSGKLISYTYAMGKIDSISINGVPLMTNIQYQPFGPVQAWTWGNGTLYVRSFDSDGRIATLPLGSSVRQIGYDAASRITSITDPLLPIANQNYSYDSLDRLTGFVNNSTTQSYAYDHDGNRIGSTLGATPYTYSHPPTSNKLGQVSGPTQVNYLYDASGNMTSDGTNLFTYNGRGRLSQVQRGANTVGYLINGLGQRVAKDKGGAGGVTYFAYDEQGHLIGEYNAANLPIQETVYLGDLPVAVIK